MPTPTLPLLHQLLIALHIPVHPPFLNATPPSLLLVILETILHTRLPLRHPIRLCQTREDELAVVKCILGVLADDILGVDLSVIDPVKVVAGGEQELAVLVMALVVVAKRNGIVVKLPPLSIDAKEDILDDDDDHEQTSLIDLPAPILPDVSYSVTGLVNSSPVRSPSTDVFDPAYPLANDGERQKQSASIGIPSLLPTRTSPPVSSDVDITSEDVESFMLASPAHTWRQDISRIDGHGQSTSLSSSNTASSGKTVLHHMLEEFGLDPCL